MAAAPTRWNDERLDDQADRLGRFEGNVDRRFDKVDERFEKVDARFDRFEGSVERQFERVESISKDRFDKADALERERFAAIHAELAVASKKADKTIWTLIGGFASILVTIVAKFLLG